MIKISDLTFHYKKGVPVLTDLNLELTAGRIYGLLGKNGTGKTTLQKLICGLLFPKKGEILIENYYPKERKPELLRELFFLQEELYIPPLKIEKFESITSPFYPKFDKNLFYQLLEDFEVERNSKLTSLSYGQQKKVFIAFGIASRCKYILMDEPTNGLDIPSKRQFRKIIASTLTDEQIYIISTHHVKDVKNLIDTILIMDKGDIILHKSISEISEKITFEFYKTKPEIGSCFYFEEMMGGYIALAVNESGEETAVDIELLFNAVVDKNTKILDILSKEGQNE